MAEDPPVCDGGQVALENVQIRAADSRGVYAHYRVRVVGDFRLGYCGVVYEMRTSLVEAMYFTGLDRRMSFATQTGPSSSIAFPKNGPYDQRLGYAELPQFISDLTANGYTVADQARWIAGPSTICRARGLPDLSRKEPCRAERL